jgi:hypothetical protein
MRIVSMAGWILAAASLGCATNYDFEKARREDGSLDAAVLRQDLRGQKSLVEGAWIPLVRLRVASFHESDEQGYPVGYEARESRFIGPLLSWMSSRRSFYDPSGELFEQIDQSELLWGLFWGRRELLVRTPQGFRSERSRYSLFGLVHGSPEVTYVELSAAAVSGLAGSEPRGAPPSG